MPENLEQVRVDAWTLVLLYRLYIRACALRAALIEGGGWTDYAQPTGLPSRGLFQMLPSTFHPCPTPHRPGRVPGDPRRTAMPLYAPQPEVHQRAVVVFLNIDPSWADPHNVGPRLVQQALSGDPKGGRAPFELSRKINGTDMTATVTGVMEVHAALRSGLLAISPTTSAFPAPIEPDVS